MVNLIDGLEEWLMINRPVESPILHNNHNKYEKGKRLFPNGEGRLSSTNPTKEGLKCIFCKGEHYDD